MNRALFLYLALLCGLVSCVSKPALPPTPVAGATATPGLLSHPVSKVLLIAQRGGAGLAGENTLTAFRIGINFNSDFLHLEVHLSRDGIPIVMRDPTIDRTTEGKGRIADMTLAELGRFSTHTTTQSYREAIPTLAQVLDLAQSKYARVQVQIQLDADQKRYPGIEQKVLDELDRRNMLGGARILASNWDTLRQVRALNPGMRTDALISAESVRSMGDLNALVKEITLFADGISADKEILSVKWVEAAHDSRMSIGVWTVDDPAEMNKFIEMGVDSIATNRPDVFRKVMGR